ncbi:MAG: MFS transporter [Pseudomonadota bacterium]
MNASAPEASPFAVPAFRWLFAAQLSALLGNGVGTLALALLVVALAPERPGEVLGVALAIKMLLYVGLAPLAPQVSLWASRFGSRKGWLVTLDLLRATTLLLMPWAVNELQIYLAIAVLSAGAALFTPVYQGLIPALISDEARYLRALSFSQMASSTMQLAAPVLAALLLLVLSFPVLFVLNALCFVVSALCVSRVRLPAHLARPTLPVRSFAAFRIYFRTPRLRAAAFAYIGVAVSSAMMIVNTAPYVTAVLEYSTALYPLAIAAGGGGTILAAALIPRWQGALRTVLVSGLALMAGAWLVAIHLPGPLWLLGLWFLIGFGLGLVQTPVGALIRRSARPADRDALFAANFSISHACWLLAYPLVGFGLAPLGWAGLFAIAAVLSTVAAAACWLTYPARDQRVLWHRHAAVEHDHEHAHDARHHPSPVAGNHQSHGLHVHDAIEHAHEFVIDEHHPYWPQPRTPA